MADDIQNPFPKPSPEMDKAQKQIRAERARCEAEMALRFANLHMPSDLRASADRWGMSALFELAWNSAFQAGYREGSRVREDK